MDGMGLCVCILYSVDLHGHLYGDFMDCFCILCGLPSKVNVKVVIIQQNLSPCFYFCLVFLLFVLNEPNRPTETCQVAERGDIKWNIWMFKVEFRLAPLGLCKSVLCYKQISIKICIFLLVCIVPCSLTAECPGFSVGRLSPCPIKWHVPACLHGSPSCHSSAV